MVLQFRLKIACTTKAETTKDETFRNGKGYEDKA